MKKPSCNLVWRLVLASVALAMAQGGVTAATVSATDKTFAKNLSLSIQFQIAASQFAEDRALSQKVKHTGNSLHISGLSTQDQLAAAVKSTGIALPATLDAPHAALLQTLVVKTGIAFDTLYLADTIQDHASIVSACAAESKSGKDAALKAVAAGITSAYQGQAPTLETLHTALVAP